MSENQSRSDMAVAVAKDVIAQVRTYQQGSVGYLPSKGHYVCADYSEVPVEGDLQDVVPDIIQKKCRVCAKGAMFLSRAKLFGGVDLGGYVDVGDYGKDHGYLGVGGGDIDVELADVFSQEQLGLIEAAFEQERVFAVDTGCNRDLIEMAVDFGEQHDDPADRMIAIMQNIVDNGGEFRP